MVSTCSVALLALVGFAAAIPHDGPLPTPVVKKFAADGWTPKPTSVPSILELFKRQEDPSFCGYLEGDPESALGCRVGASCMYNEAYQWFGCCTGSDVQDCNIQTACVNSASYSKCLAQSSCANDPLATACLLSRAPYCVQLYTVITGSTYGHFACGATDTSYEVLATTTGGFGASSTGGLSSTRSQRTGSQSSTTDDGTPSSIPSSTSAFLFSFVDSSTTTSANGGGPTPKGSTTTSAKPTAASTGGARRTAEAALGAVGGVAGLLFLFA